MEFKLGEFVRFVDERMEGYVTRIISNDMIGVTGEDDFEIPVLTTKVTRVHGHKYADAAQQFEAEAPVSSETFEKKGIFLAVVPDPNKASVVHFHLVNDTSFQLLVTLVTDKAGTSKGEFAGSIQAHSAVEIYSTNLSDMSIWPEFIIRGLYFSKSGVEIPEAIQYTEKFRARDFAGAKKKVARLNKEAWVFRIDEDELVIDAEKLKESFFKPVAEKKVVEKPSAEIDLHIEKLRDDYQFLSNTEILKIQMDHYKKALDAAIVHKLPSITFIHGIGNGTLKQEIHKTLGRNNQVKTFLDARKEKFGYGATEVILK
ncbi:MAG: Smr/MutS family protein [Arcticibacter sp.]